MTITRQDILDAYNSIYSTTNNNVLKTYEQLSDEEKIESLLIYLNNNGVSGGSGTGGASAAEIKTSIETATNLNDLENILNAILTLLGSQSDIPNTDENFNTSLISYIKGIIYTTREILNTSNSISENIGTGSNLPVTDVGIDANYFSYFKGLLLLINSLVARIPATLGQKTSANSFPVVLASDSSFSSLKTTGSNSVSSTIDIFSTEITNNDYTFISFHATGTFTAVWTVEGSNNNTNWITLTALNTSYQFTTAIFANTTGLFYVPITTRYIRVRCSSYTSGTISISWLFSNSPSSLTSSMVDTELPVIATINDTFGGSSSSTTFIANWNMLFNGTNYVRQRATNSISGEGLGRAIVTPNVSSFLLLSSFTGNTSSNVIDLGSVYNSLELHLAVLTGTITTANITVFGYSLVHGSSNTYRYPLAEFNINSLNNSNPGIIRINNSKQFQHIIAVVTNSSGTYTANLACLCTATSGKGSYSTQSQSLTSPGTGNSFSFYGMNNLICSYQVANINTSIVVRLEHSLDAVNWSNTDSEDTIITSNGLYSFNLNNFNLDNMFIRFNFVSETGGTAATINIIYTASDY